MLFLGHLVISSKIIRHILFLLTSFLLVGCVPTGDLDLIKLKLGITRPQDLTYLPRRAPSENPAISPGEATHEEAPSASMNQGLPIISQAVEEKTMVAPDPSHTMSMTEEKPRREAPLLHADLAQDFDFNEEIILGEKEKTKVKDFPALSNIHPKETWDHKKADQEKEELLQAKEKIQKKKGHEKKNLEKNDLLLSEPTIKEPMISEWPEEKIVENKPTSTFSYKTLKPPRDAFSFSSTNRKIRSLKPSRYGYKRMNPLFSAEKRYASNKVN